MLCKLWQEKFILTNKTKLYGKYLSVYTKALYSLEQQEMECLYRFLIRINITFANLIDKFVQTNYIQ